MKDNEPACLRCEYCRVDPDVAEYPFCALDHGEHNEPEIGVGKPSPDWCPLKQAGDNERKYRQNKRIRAKI